MARASTSSQNEIGFIIRVAGGLPKLRDPRAGHRPPASDVTPVAAVERALALLGAFRVTDDALTLAELAARTALNKATILRLAATLQQFGYLSRLATGEFQIGPAPLALATMFQRAMQPAERIMPSLERLARETGESAGFFIALSDERRVCLYRVDSPHVVRQHLRTGDVGPMDRGAAGRVLKRFGAGGPVDGDLVTITAGEVTPDVRAAAAPVFDAFGRVAGALSVSGPQFRFTPAACANALPLLRAAAREVTLRIGGEATMFDDAHEGVRHAD